MSLQDIPGGISPEDAAKMQEALDKYAQELVETEIKAAQEREDIAIDLGRTLVDIETEYDRKRSDVLRDYNDKVRDINQSYNEDVADIREKQAEDEQKRRNDDLKREQEYQNRLLEMRENYLMDLEDALHNRDARQILKLMRQYELDKLQAARKHALDDEQAQTEQVAARRSIQIEIKKAQDKRTIALLAAKQDEQDKLAQLAIDQKREEDDAKLKAARKNEDLIKANADKMALLAAQLVQEYNLTGEWVKRMVGLYKTYYDSVKKVYENIALMKAAANAAGMATPPTSTTNGNWNWRANQQQNVPQNNSRRGRSGRFAEGGSMFANRPTTVTFGEAGLEMASFMPLGRVGKDVNKSFSNMSGAGGSGKVSIELLLSPDLESRIISNTLDRTAEVFVRVQKGR
jgi:hypothetical protein